MTTRVLLTAAVVALSLAPSAHAGTRSCGTVAGNDASQVTASGTTCKAAKKVVRAWYHKKHPYGYTCKLRMRNGSSFKVSCRRPGKLVTWIGHPVG